MAMFRLNARLFVEPAGPLRNKLVRLKRLKNSPRTLSLAPSLPTNQGMWKYLDELKSTLANPGPRNEFRPAFPSHEPEPQFSRKGCGLGLVFEGACTVGQGIVNSLAEKQPPFSQVVRLHVRSFTPGATLGIRQAPPLPVGLWLQSTIVNGYPDWRVVVPLHCQPPRIPR